MKKQIPIAISDFKDIKYDSWENTLKAFAALFSDVYKKYLYLLESTSMLKLKRLSSIKYLISKVMRYPYPRL